MMDASHQELEEENCGVDVNEGTVKSIDLQENTNQVIGNEDELGSCGNSSPSDELVQEQYLGDTLKMDSLNQPFLQATCKSVGVNNEDRSNDHYVLIDVQTGRKQQTESGKILELVQKKKKQSLGAKESDTRDRTVTPTVSEKWLKKNQDSDVNLPFRDPDLPEKKDKNARHFHKDGKWLRSEPLLIGVLQEFTLVRSAEKSVSLVREEHFHAYSQKCKKSNTESSDNLSVITEEPSDFISLESEKKKAAALWSKLIFIITPYLSSFFFWKNEKWAEDEIHLTEGVKLLPDSKQVIASSVGAFFETKGKSFDKKNESSETEQQIASDIDVTEQEEMLGVEIDERTVTDIELQEKKKHDPRQTVLRSNNELPLVGFATSTFPPTEELREIGKKKYHLGQIMWLPINSLPLPINLNRDAIVGFFEEQTRDGHGGSTLPHTEHEELREMLRQLASDNVPGPQITMKYEMLRLCTMKTFPGRDRPFAIRIVGAGFYYAGHKDQVICYCCGNRKDSWVLGDIPLLIHQNMSPDCDFLRHNTLVNVPIRKANFTESSPLEIRRLVIQRANGSNQSDMAQSESSLILSSSEHNRVNISNLVVAPVRQNVLDLLQTGSADTCAMEEAHPQYAAKNKRINSFQGWPAEVQQRPEEMAECGFYYAGFEDFVRCFCCRVVLRHWTSEDDPWIEHARWSTECKYVLEMKGEEFVSLVKMAVEIAEREKAARSYDGGNKATEYSSEAAQSVAANEVAAGNSSIANSTPSKDVTASTGVTGGNANEAVASTPSPGNTEIQKYLLTDAAQSVLDMGYQPKLVQQAIERVLLKKGTEELTGQIVMKAVLEIEEENKVQLNPRGSVQSAEGHECVGKAKMKSETSNKQDGQLRARVLEKASSAEVQIDPEKIRREHRELYEASLCKVCLENTISMVFLPCGHLVTCPDCAPAMVKCPVCKTLIKGTVKKLFQ